MADTSSKDPGVFVVDDLAKIVNPLVGKSVAFLYNADGGNWWRCVNESPVTWEMISSGGGGGATGIYVVSGLFRSTPPSGTVMGFHVVAEDVTIPAGGTKSHGKALIAATAQADFDIQRNGVSVGTMRFAAAATVASFIIASPIALSEASGDDIRVISPVPPDSTLSGITFSLWGSRNTTGIYVTSGFFAGTIPSGTVMGFHVVAEDTTIPVGAPQCHGKALVAATAQADFDIQKNGSSIGTMRFAAAATTATFIFASPVAFAEASNDDIRVIAPASPDVTLASVGFTIRGTR